MNIGKILIWYSLTLFWLLVACLAIVRLRRILRGEPAFTDKDWLLLFGLPRDRIMTGFWLRFALANLVVIALGFAIVLLLLPYAVGWAVALTAMAVIMLLPKFLKSAGRNAE
jgi:hypothetical protein